MRAEGRVGGRATVASAAITQGQGSAVVGGSSAPASVGQGVRDGGRLCLGFLPPPSLFPFFALFRSLCGGSAAASKRVMFHSFTCFVRPVTRHDTARPALALLSPGAAVSRGILVLPSLSFVCLFSPNSPSRSGAPCVVRRSCPVLSCSILSNPGNLKASFLPRQQGKQGTNTRRGHTHYRMLGTHHQYRATATSGASVLCKRVRCLPSRTLHTAHHPQVLGAGGLAALLVLCETCKSLVLLPVFRPFLSSAPRPPLDSLLASAALFSLVAAWFVQGVGGRGGTYAARAMTVASVRWVIVTGQDRTGQDRRGQERRGTGVVSVGGAHIGVGRVGGGCCGCRALSRRVGGEEGGFRETWWPQHLCGVRCAVLTGHHV